MIDQPGLYDFFKTGFDRKGGVLSQKKVKFKVDFFLVLLHQPSVSYPPDLVKNSKRIFAFVNRELDS